MHKILTCLFLLFGLGLMAQDMGDGTYQNPILPADYSDPDVIRVGDDFWMTASSFNCIPGLPILHSKDLVNWEIVNYALKKQPPFDVFDKPQHGGGVWAPAIRYHNGEFFIIYPDPDFGIYMTKTRDPRGDWSEPVLMKAGKGLIDRHAKLTKIYKKVDFLFASCFIAIKRPKSFSGCIAPQAHWV